jgi:hypothetical protein
MLLRVVVAIPEKFYEGCQRLPGNMGQAWHIASDFRSGFLSCLRPIQFAEIPAGVKPLNGETVLDREASAYS